MITRVPVSVGSGRALVEEVAADELADAKVTEIVPRHRVQQCGEGAFGISAGPANGGRATSLPSGRRGAIGDVTHHTPARVSRMDPDPFALRRAGPSPAEEDETDRWPIRTQARSSRQDCTWQYFG